MAQLIHSSRNPRIQGVTRLQTSARTRRESGAFVVEGVRLAEEALKSGRKITQAFFTADLNERGKEMVVELESRQVPVFEVTQAVMSQASDTETPQGLLLEIPIPKASFSGKQDFVIIIDQLRDPGNLGTLMRTAVAVGAGGVALTPGSVDPYSPKVVRSAMGAHFQLDVGVLAWDKIENICKALTVYLADMQGDSVFWEADFRGPIGLLIGGEAHGASERAKQLASRTIYLPMPGDAESLNAAVAGSVIAFEVLRQRGYRGR